ncbi:MAG: ABC transporter ATP-binding protein, partial [Butyrivibrio sp.]|nr:ABC transporter ATP-binding protein [Butyrivibrio sp.]
ILLADEPTGAVDSKTADMIFDLFRRLNEKHGLTILIVTHDMSLADKVQRTVMIADGKISTEKVRRELYEKSEGSFAPVSGEDEETHEEFSVLDKAHRLQLRDEVLAQAGITSNRVKVEVVDGKVVISKEN